LEDFEIGKVLHRWSEGQVCRARQKSLDRPVLVWIEEKPAKEKPKSEESEPRMEHGQNTDLSPCSVRVPSVAKSDYALSGVVVRHPEVLALHAVGSGKEGQFLVTESAAAVPLPEWLLRRPLLPAEATALGVRLARILQGFHEQGFIHGRLSAEWIMLQGELEPLLCPCGVPSQSMQARRNDLMALGRLLNEWLAPRPAKWQRQARADLYRVIDAAVRGKYVRARSLADDLERAARAARIRWRVRLGNVLVIGLAVLPLLAWAVERFGTDSTWVARHLLLLLSPSAVLLGYTFCRDQIQSRRLRLGGWALSETESGVRPSYAIGRFRFQNWILHGLAQLALLVIPVVALTLTGLWSSLLAAGALIGYWLWGALIAGVVTAAEWIRRSLRPDIPDSATTGQ
jgi:hypothetical protein